jgi:hypothetical protein
MINQTPIPASGRSVACSDANARIALDGLLRTACVLSLLNVGPNPVFVRFSQNTTDVASAASPTADFVILPNERVFLHKPQRPDNASDTQLNAICAATQTATLWVHAIDKQM